MDEDIVCTHMKVWEIVNKIVLIKNKKEITITCINYTYYKNKGYDIPKIIKNNKTRRFFIFKLQKKHET
mgnify:CR=1 FL=1